MCVWRQKFTPPPSKLAFSLIELSIVLVILGLLTGGIIAGQSLIRAAELRSVSTDFERYSVALTTFRGKYFALPGDMTNAVRFWGAQAGGTTDGADSTCSQLDVNNPATNQATCNGNGNLMVYNFANTGLAGGYEVFRAWQHLANAGLIEGQYAGVAAGTYNTVINDDRPGWNVPASRISQSGYMFIYFGNDPNAAHTILLPANYGHVLNFGSNSSYHGSGIGPIITPSEAWNIDSKMDDGKPAQGRILTIASSSPNLCTDNNTVTAEYALSVTGKNCALILKTGF